MSKSKDKSRPKYECPKCFKVSWVADKQPRCILCGCIGVPTNDGAKKQVEKLKGVSEP